jgi:hypothetical protein
MFFRSKSGVKRHGLLLPYIGGMEMAKKIFAGTIPIFFAFVCVSVVSVAQGGVVIDNPVASGSVLLTDHFLANLELTLNETVNATQPGQWGYLALTGNTDTDPSLHIVKSILNDSTFEWTDYHVVVTGSAGVSYIPGSAASDRFQVIVPTIEPGSATLDFYAPLSVPIGDTVTIAFDVILPAGMFSLNIDQRPTPEPFTMLLMSMGGMVLLRRRRA